MFGNYASLVSYSSNAVVLLTIGGLIIIGGLGFTVSLEIFNYRKARRFSTHSKMVISITLALIVFGTIIYVFSGI